VPRKSENDKDEMVNGLIDNQKSAMSTAPREEVFRRFFPNFGASFAAQIWSVGVSFVTLPVIVRGMGTERYGVWTVCLAFYAFFLFLELMLSTTAVRFLSSAQGKGAEGEFRAIFQRIYVASWGIGAAAGLLLLSVSGFAATRLSRDVAFQPDVFLVLQWLSLSLLFRIPSSVLSGSIGAVQRLDIISLFVAVTQTIQSIGLAVILSQGAGIEGAVKFWALSWVVVWIGYEITARRLIPKTSSAVPPPRLWRQAIQFSGSLLIGYGGAPLQLPFSRLILGALSGPAAVAFFSLPATLASQVRRGLYHLSSTALPAAGALEGNQDAEGLRLLWVKSHRAAWIGFLPLVVGGGLLGAPFIGQWIGPEFGQAAQPIMLPVIGGLFGRAMGNIGAVIMQGCGHGKIWAAFSLGSGLINVLLALVLIPRWGIRGAAWALLAGGVIAGVLVFLVTIGRLGISRPRFARAFSWRAGAVALVAGTLLHFFQHSDAGLFQILTSAVLLVCFYGVGIFWFVLSKEERQRVLALRF